VLAGWALLMATREKERASKKSAHEAMLVHEAKRTECVRFDALLKMAME
jgi:hypothetical protein